MKNVARFDHGTVKGDAKLTAEGYIKANAIVTRTGIFHYQNQDGSIRKELRHPDDVWNLDSIQSMEMIPITNGHPTERMVTTENFKRLAIGYTGQNIKKDGDFILSNLIITDKDGINAVINDGRKELSLGYLVDLEETSGVYKGEHYDAKQTNIRYNHLAIVDKARAGKEARIALDSYDAIEIFKEKSEVKMAKRKIKIDDEELMIEESVADYLDKLEADLKNLQEERNRVESEIQEIRDKLEKALAERDNLSSQVSEMKEENSNSDGSNFKKAVKERVSLENIAKDTLTSGTLSKLDSMSNNDIKKEVIRIARKSINIDGKSQVYIDCMFDTILDEKKEMKVNLDNVQNTKVENDGNISLVNARQNMMQNQKKLNKNFSSQGVK